MRRDIRRSTVMLSTERSGRSLRELTPRAGSPEVELSPSPANPCRLYDLAHGCFTLCGVTALVLGITRASYTGAEWAGGVGGLLVGIALAIWLWRHWPLGVLAAASALLVAQSVTEYGSPLFQKAVPILRGMRC